MNVKLDDVSFYIATSIFNYFLIYISRVFKYTFEEAKYMYTELELNFAIRNVWYLVIMAVLTCTARSLWSDVKVIQIYMRYVALVLEFYIAFIACS